MPPFRTHEAIGPHRMALQTTREDRRDRHDHWNVVDFGSTVEIPRSSQQTSVRLNARRGAIDMGSPQNWAPVRQFIQPVVVPPAVLRGLPPLPALSPRAPSLWEDHPYTLLRLANLGSGNYQPPPLPSGCAECQMNEFVASEYTKLTNEPFPVVPDSLPASKYIGPRRGEMHVQFVSNSSTRPGVPVKDILRFTDDLKDPHYKLVQHKGGPIKLTLLIEGCEPVEDILYANCCHREITRLQLAWALAFSFHRLAKASGVDPEGLMLMAFVSGNKRSTWAAYARH
ncbi:hypothetical protein C8R45DRAFT_91767 [Mycena sanguinolenta]|nr:hypothetical protein C8R45DRAFT_91767 [Mycena sanguinolenta]